MNDISKTIGWADLSWNPITGCLGGCPYCYARAMARRLQGMGVPQYANGFTPSFHPQLLDQPARRRKPAKIFVCSMADLFGDGVESDWIESVANAVHAAPRHTYLTLTNRPGRMLSTQAIESWLPWGHLWTGITATDQARWDLAVRSLSVLPPSVVRWISVEPLLGPITLGDWVPDWVVIGLLSPRPDHRSHLWAHDLISDLRARGVPVYAKTSLPEIACHEWPKGVGA